MNEKLAKKREIDIILEIGIYVSWENGLEVLYMQEKKEFIDLNL